MDSTSFDVIVSCKGRNETIAVSTDATPSQVYGKAIGSLGLDQATSNIKLLFKGKRIDPDDNRTRLFASVPKKTPKLLALVTSVTAARDIASKKSDPTIRGFAQEEERDRRKKEASSSGRHWGPSSAQDRHYRFVRIEACTWQSFGHRPTESTPHAFEAMALLEKLSTDPGVVAIMKERELVVNTLGEMDPIDDRLMQKKQEEGGCLLGYNTNHGLRIDIKLRTDDLSTFRPYAQLVVTLIHELSHNWVGDHNLLFWTNYAQMRAEYLYTHRRLQSSLLVQGKTAASVAGVPKEALEDVRTCILQELAQEMAQHGLHPRMIADAVRQRCDELEATVQQGRRVGRTVESSDGDTDRDTVSAREKALAAAERRAEEQRRGRKGGTD